eukprot:6395802-Ditylum_brightwellii.AAC.1
MAHKTNTSDKGGDGAFHKDFNLAKEGKKARNKEMKEKRGYKRQIEVDLEYGMKGQKCKIKQTTAQEKMKTAKEKDIAIAVTK